MQHIVFGANGYVGSYVYKRLKQDSIRVLGTGRRGDNGLIEFDICNGSVPSFIKEISPGFSALICIAKAGIDYCYTNYDYAYNINVVRTKQLIDYLVRYGAYIVFLSTDNVFDGKDGLYVEDSATTPINQYGRMKVEMEKYLQYNVPNACIFRLSKVVGSQRDSKNILTDWEQKISEGEIPCIKGNRLSFVCHEDIYQAYALACQMKLKGIYHVVGDRSYSRAELAKNFLKLLEKENEILVREYDVTHFLIKDKWPLDVSLVNTKFKSKTGYEFTDIAITLREYIENMH